MATISMYGPAFDETKKIVNREVPSDDVPAFEAAGYKKGKDPDAPTVKAGESKGGTAKPDEPEKPEKEAKTDGKLPEDFPGYDALKAEGITTFAKLKKVENLTDVPGIGEATAEKIVAALKDKS